MNKTKRLTIDFPAEEHMYLKLASTKLGMSMKEFIVKHTIKAIEDLEDDLLAEKARKISAQIESGEIETVSWDEIKGELLQ